MASIPPTATILNVKVHALTMAHTLALLEQFIASGRDSLVFEKAIQE